MVKRFFKEFLKDSWSGWRLILDRLTETTREMYIICGRGAGKSRITALIAVCYALHDYPNRVPGERLYVGVFAPDRKQATVTFRYIVGLLKSVKAFRSLIVKEFADSIELTNGIIIEVITARASAPRARSYVLAIIEEAAFLNDDTTSNPDVELLRALRPGLGRVPGSLLVVLSSPYKRQGILWEAYKRNHEKPREEVVVIKASTQELNPTFDKATIDLAYEEDPESADAEYGANFRTNVSDLLRAEVVDACIVDGQRELPPVTSQYRYCAFVDPSGSGADSFTVAVGHTEESTVIIDATREYRPPYSPEQVTTEIAMFVRSYGCQEVVGDRWGGEWPREAFRKNLVNYVVATKNKSQLYRDALAMLNSNRVKLPDDPRLRSQLLRLERTTGRGGKDTIDHAPGGHDDVANAVCGVIDVCLTAPPPELFDGVVW